MPEPRDARHGATAAPVDVEDSRLLALYGILKREPILFVTLAYLLVSFVGLWASYWFYDRFGLPVLEYLQVGDFLVTGLRDPRYAAAVAGAVLFAWLVNWPHRWRRRHPERVEALRRTWWGRIVFRDLRHVSRETTLAFAIFWCSIWMLLWFVSVKANRIHAGGGHAVRVTLVGDQRPQPEDARLLGTSGNYVFLYWPHSDRAEAIPVAALARIESLRAAPPQPAPAATRPRPASPVR